MFFDSEIGVVLLLELLHIHNGVAVHVDPLEPLMVQDFLNIDPLLMVQIHHFPHQVLPLLGHLVFLEAHVSGQNFLLKQLEIALLERHVSSQYAEEQHS